MNVPLGSNKEKLEQAVLGAFYLYLYSIIWHMFLVKLLKGFVYFQWAASFIPTGNNGNFSHLLRPPTSGLLSPSIGNDIHIF